MNHHILRKKYYTKGHLKFINFLNESKLNRKLTANTTYKSILFRMASHAYLLNPDLTQS